VKFKELKHSNYFFQFVTEVFMETLEFCELNSIILEMLDYVMRDSTTMVFDQLIQLILKNKQELKTEIIILFNVHYKKLTESHIISIFEKLEGMKEGILKIEELNLKYFFSHVSSKKSPKCSEILKRFHFLN
jgi:hypothetical protein